MRHEWRFHRRSDEEHEWNPPECSPNNEESVSHSVFFVLQLPKKCSEKESLCQPISTGNLPRISLILLALIRTRAFVRALAKLSLALGSAKLAVPTCTAEAPTDRYWSTSSTVSMPPKPITGIFTAFLVSQTSRRVMGRIAGPERPPVRFPKHDIWVRVSTAIAGKVFATVKASAPADSAARPISPMSATSGDNFTHKGRRTAALRVAPTTSATWTGSLPNCIPPFFTFGQEMLSSYPAKPSASSRMRMTST